MQLNLAADHVAVLEARTEGCVVGLQLAASSLQERADVRNFVQAFTSSHRYIVDYLIEEVLRRQSESMQSLAGRDVEYAITPRPPVAV